MSGNEFVKNEEFMLQIYNDEFNQLRSQIVTSNDNLNLKSQFATLEKWDSLRSQNATIEGRRGQRRKYLPHAFTPKQWIEKTNAIGFVSKAGRCGGIYSIAKCDTFKAVFGQQAVAQLTQIPLGHNIAIIPKCGNLKKVKVT